MTEEIMNTSSNDEKVVENHAPAREAMPVLTSRRDLERGVLYIGIDLGTSRTVVTASNGTRVVVESVVGYPKDMVSRKKLKRDVLFGEEARKNRLALNLFHPLEKGVLKYSDDPTGVDQQELTGNIKAARDLINHVVDLTNPKPNDIIYGVIGCPAEATAENREAIEHVSREAFDAVFICSEPFAVAYGMDNYSDALVIDIGAGTTDLCRMKGAEPDESDQITLLEAGDFVDETLLDLLQTRCKNASYNKNMVKKIKERYSFVTETSEPVVVTLPVHGRPTEFDITEEVRRACRSIIDPIVDAMVHLIGTFDPEFQDTLKQNVVIAGGGSQIFGLERELEMALQDLGGGRVTRVPEPVFAGANGALKVAHDIPWD